MMNDGYIKFSGNESDILQFDSFDIDLSYLAIDIHFKNAIESIVNPVAGYQIKFTRDISGDYWNVIYLNDTQWNGWQPSNAMDIVGVKFDIINSMPDLIPFIY